MRFLNLIKKNIIIKNTEANEVSYTARRQCVSFPPYTIEDLSLTTLSLLWPPPNHSRMAPPNHSCRTMSPPHNRPPRRNPTPPPRLPLRRRRGGRGGLGTACSGSSCRWGKLEASLGAREN